MQMTIGHGPWHLGMPKTHEPIAFAQLMIRDGSDALEDELQKSLMAAVSGGPTAEKDDPLQSKLNKVEQLTGFSDPVYAEAYVNVNQYDIVLDVLIVNQTADTLQVKIWNCVFIRR